MKNIIFAGLDGEMTGSIVNEHELIQIGLAFSENEKYVSKIGWDTFNYNPESLEVIGVNVKDIKNWPKAKSVDLDLVDWLNKMNVKKNSIIPVGWEVAAFDRPFIKKTLPKFYTYLHHHSVELNSVVYTFGSTMPYLGKRPKAYLWKKMAKFSAVFNIKCEEARWPKSHDAGEDAYMSLTSWRWLRNIIADGNPGGLEIQPKEANLYGRITEIDATKGLK